MNFFFLMWEFRWSELGHKRVRSGVMPAAWERENCRLRMAGVFVSLTQLLPQKGRILSKQSHIFLLGLTNVD